METPTSSPTRSLPEPISGLRAFRQAYTKEEAQQELCRWFVCSLQQNYDGLSSDRTINLITFYENLKELISAVYQFHDLRGKGAQEALRQQASTMLHPDSAAHAGAISQALDTLHHRMPQSWTLLISPPE
ncbi:hypothetical protein [Pontibacter mangrovi]|uniref:Uncharacterized protein n=1 Tax=Pontibacter mangrovi TaxID=2589816 RepID=A0A501W592_9BACT|nr:hypothetical protein [Pontibacter mangrovi]TPE42411.1 hypothetical protein FJM65_18490 [Pontibacter mangrovi]